MTYGAFLKRAMYPCPKQPTRVGGVFADGCSPTSKVLTHNEVGFIMFIPNVIALVPSIVRRRQHQDLCFVCCSLSSPRNHPTFGHSMVLFCNNVVQKWSREICFGCCELDHCLSQMGAIQIGHSSSSIETTRRRGLGLCGSSSSSIALTLAGVNCRVRFVPFSVAALAEVLPPMA